MESAKGVALQKEAWKQTIFLVMAKYGRPLKIAIRNGTSGYDVTKIYTQLYC